MKKFLLLFAGIFLSLAINAQTKVGIEHLSQNFSDGVTANGWTIDAQAGNWSAVQSVNAGGIAPEARMSWTPQFNATTRLISPTIDISGQENVVVQFKHAIDHYGGAYTVGLATRSEGGEWNTVWSRSGATVVEAISVPVTNDDLGSSTFQVCMFFSGNSYNINYWYIDDILVYTPYANDIAVSSINNEAYAIYDNYNISATLKNVGLNPVTSFDISYQINDDAIITESISGISIGSGEAYTYTFTSIWEAVAGIYQVNVNVSNINENGDDDDMSNNSLAKQIHIASQSVANLPLFESFTSSTCGPCYTFNTNTFTPFLNSHIGEYAIIKYQMSWPGSGDPYYTAEGGVRRTYYGVTGVPSLFTGGSATAISAVGLDNALSTQAAKDAFFEINATANIVGGNSVFASIDIIPHISVNNFTMHAAVIEQETTGNVASNGETSFKYVMMKMLPSASGTQFSSVDGETLTFNLGADLTTTNVEEYDDLMVVVFIQNNETKEVFQSTMVNATEIVDNYAVTFNVTSNFNEEPIEDALITINGEELTTNELGEAYMLLANGSYSYEIIKDDFVTLQGDFDVADENISLNLALDPIEYTVSFTIIDELTELPIEGATISISEQTLTTSATGTATINLPSYTYNYTVSAESYLSKNNTLTVSGADADVEESLTPVFTVTFSITDNEANPIENAIISVAEEVLTTNAEGEATINLINGEYPYTVVKDGFETYESTATVDGQDQEVNVALNPASNANVLNSMQLSIFPNPSNGEVNISLQNEEKVSTLEVYSITGALVFSKTYNANISNLKENINQPQGVYMVRVTLSNGETSIGKLIVK